MVPTNLFMWIMACLPIIALLVLMIVCGWGATEAAPIGLLITILTGVFVYKADLKLLASESAKGIWSALPILLIVWTAILLYQAGNEANAFQVIRNGMRRLLPNELLQVLALGWVLESFLQGITGFGVPVAVGAPLLIGIGVTPLWAVILPLLGQAWGNTFGTLAAAWDSLASSAELETGSAAYFQTAFYTAAFICIWLVIGLLAFCWFYGKGKAIKKGLPVILVIAVIQGGGELLLSQVNTTLCCFIPACVSLIAILIMGRMKMYNTPWQAADSPIMNRADAVEVQNAARTDAAKDPITDRPDTAAKAEGPIIDRVDAAKKTAAHESVNAETKKMSGAQVPGSAAGAPDTPKMNLAQAFVPYFVLSALTLAVLLITPINNVLSRISFGPSFPETSTGYGYVNEAAETFSAFTPFTHASMFLLVSAIAGLVYYRKKGWIKKGGIKRAFVNSVSMTVPSGIAVIGLVIMSKIMDGTGQTEVLANGIAGVLGRAYVVLAPFIGLLGTFMTGSNMSSNILFGGFQVTTANLLGVSSPVILGAQSAGGAIGSAISPSKIILGTTTAGIRGKEGEVMKKLMLVTIPVTIVIGAAALLIVL